MLSLVPLLLYAFTALYLLKEQRFVLDDMTDRIYETSNQVDTLVLNADRDMYQAYQAYLRVESGTLDQANEDAARAELAENIKQVEDRVGEAQAILYEKGLQNLSTGESARSINQILIEFKANFNFWTVAAVKAAGLVETLEGPGPFTVFAPTNSAFDKLPAGTVETLLKPENKEKLTSVLTYHVVPGKIGSKELMSMVKAGNGKATLKTVQGENLYVTMKGKKLMITDENGGVATVTIADVNQSNGVIHVVDTVLLPK